MSEAQVMTVTGLLPASSLGPTDAHEHLFLRTPALAGQEFEGLDEAIGEVRDGQASGLRAIVELTPIGCGRRPDGLRAVAEATGAAIVAASGYHRDAHYPAGHWVHDAPDELLEQRIVDDIERGMHPADWLDPARPPDPARAGVIKAGASYQHLTAGERRRLEAAARAARRTGTALVVHAEVGTCGPEIVRTVSAQGLPADRLVLAHLDRNPDPELHAELANEGLSLVYDTPGRIKYGPDSDRLKLIEELLAAGHLERLMLGLDLGRRDYLRAYGGGPGLRYLMSEFVPRLVRRLGEQAVQQILVGNPARVFARAQPTEAIG